MHHAPCRMCHASCCPMCHVYSIVCTSSFMIYHLSFSIIDFNDFITFHFFISRSSFLFIINNFNLSFIHFLFSSITRFYLSVFVSISSYFLFPYCFSNYPVVICYDWLLNIFCSEFRLLLLQYSLSIIDFSNFIGYSHQSLPLFSARKPRRTCYQSLRRLWSTCPDPPRRILPLLLVVRVTHESHGSHKPMTPECYWKHWEMAWLNKDSESDQRQARIAPGPLPDATSLKVEWSCFEHLSIFVPFTFHSSQHFIWIFDTLRSCRYNWCLRCVRETISTQGQPSKSGPGNRPDTTGWVPRQWSWAIWAPSADRASAVGRHSWSAVNCSRLINAKRYVSCWGPGDCIYNANS